METSGGTAAQRPPHSIALILALTALLSLAAVAVSGGLPTPRISPLHTPHAPLRVQSNPEVPAANRGGGGHRPPDHPARVARWESTKRGRIGGLFICDTRRGF